MEGAKAIYKARAKVRAKYLMARSNERRHRGTLKARDMNLMPWNYTPPPQTPRREGTPEETVDLTVDDVTTTCDPGPSEIDMTPVQELDSDDDSDDEIVLPRRL